MTVWQVGAGELTSLNDPFPGGPDGHTAHSYRPPDHVEMTAPVRCVTTRPVPRVFRDGLLVVPGTVDVDQPWSRLDLVVDVLRKRPDLSVPGPPPVWTLEPEPRGGDRWTCTLECPLDWPWLLAHALLPDDVRQTTWRDGPMVLDAYYVIRAPQRADDRGWVAAGWRQGEPFAGPLPTEEERALWDRRSRHLWAQEHRRAEAELRKAQGPPPRWWRR